MLIDRSRDVQLESEEMSEALMSTGVGTSDWSRACDRTRAYDRSHDIPAL
jgi:hypothetical protein